MYKMTPRNSVQNDSDIPLTLLRGQISSSETAGVRIDAILMFRSICILYVRANVRNWSDTTIRDDLLSIVGTRSGTSAIFNPSGVKSGLIPRWV